jgi:drug/metabolite transporter (DMT)-like permease
MVKILPRAKHGSVRLAKPDSVSGVSRRGLGLFVALSVIWGIPYLLIKVAIAHVSAPDLVFARTAIGAALLLPVAAWRGELRSVVARWKPLIVYSLVELIVPWVLLADAERRLSSSLSGLLVSAVPLVGAVIALLSPGGDRLSTTNVAGLGLGLAGVAVLLGFTVSGSDMGSVAIVGVTVLGYAAGPAVMARRLGDLPPLGVAAVSVGLCAVVYAPWALTHAPPAVPARAAEAIIVLGVVCTAVAFVAFFALIAEIGAVKATVITYLNPAVAVALGATVLGEAVTWATAVGFLMILCGAYLATRRKAAPVLA